MYVIKDLVTDFTRFMKQYASIRPYLIRKDDAELGRHQLLQSMKDRGTLVCTFQYFFKIVVP